MAEEKGVWRTVSGRRIFIKEGQSLSSAMKESGKFKGIAKKSKGNYDNLQQYEVYERADKLANSKDVDYETKDKINKLLNRIDNANRRSGNAQKPTEELRELLKENENRANTEKRDVSKNVYDKKVYSKDFQGQKEKAKDELDMKEKNYFKEIDKHDYANKEWSKRVKELQEDYYNSKNKYDENFNEKMKSVKANESNYKDVIEYNDYIARKNANKIMEERVKPTISGVLREKMMDEYYEQFRNAERKNAEIKNKFAKPEDKYSYTPAYATWKEKIDKITGTKYDEDGTIKEYKNKTFSGRELTNDEFMEHLEDANWHTERRKLLNANLTNQQMSYIKDKTNLDWGSADLDRERTDKLIEEAKKKYPSSSSNSARYNVTSNTANKSLTSRYSGTISYLRETTNLSNAEILKLIKKMEEEAKK